MEEEEGEEGAWEGASSSSSSERRWRTEKGWGAGHMRGVVIRRLKKVDKKAN